MGPSRFTDAAYLGKYKEQAADFYRVEKAVPKRTVRFIEVILSVECVEAVPAKLVLAL